MTENETKEFPASTRQEDTEKENTVTTPEAKAEITIPVKYNKEIKELDLNTAALLAQKGMKYDVIAEDYAELKRLAQEQNKSVPGYLAELKLSRLEQRKNYLTEKCGGDSELAEHIAKLEMSNSGYDNGFKELTGLFPEIKTELDLPQEVLENANTKGTLLLDEYLRYRLQKQREQAAAALREKEAGNSSLGSQTSRPGAENPEAEEFLKGLWR